MVASRAEEPRPARPHLRRRAMGPRRSRRPCRATASWVQCRPGRPAELSCCGVGRGTGLRPSRGHAGPACGRPEPRDRHADPEASPIALPAVAVAATRRRLCGDFRGCWQSYGLNLGDAGASLRESLALLGYPISEALTDP